MKTYIKLLIEGLEKKLAVLEEIQAANQLQTKLIKAEKFDEEAFDHAMDVKSEQIERLNRLDDGFDSVYSHVRERLPLEKDLYREEIKTMQELIRKVTDLSTSIQVAEQRNRAALETVFQRENEKLRVMQNKNRLMQNYANHMNQINYIDPQFMDRKK